jgi:hypothetical protein
VRSRSSSISLLWLLLLSFTADAQQLPLSATPRGVVYAFLTETASSRDSVDRLAFASRLSGEFSKTDPRSLKGTFPAGAVVRIDSIPNLSPTSDDRLRVVAYATVQSGRETSNLYLFCSRDSIWRIESMRGFPTSRQRTQIAKTLRELDTTTRTNQLMRSDLQRMLLSDDSLAGIVRANLDDLRTIVEPLEKGKLWKEFALRDVDFQHLDEYRELDDDVTQREMIFYTIDRAALERIKGRIGIRRVLRDVRYPGTIFLVAATMQGNSYGYIHAPEGTMLPEVSGREFVMLKPVAKGWWLYKRVE